MKRSVTIPSTLFEQSRYLGQCALTKALEKMFPNAERCVVTGWDFYVYFENPIFDIKCRFEQCELETIHEKDRSLGDLLVDMHYSKNPENLSFNFITALNY